MPVRVVVRTRDASAAPEFPGLTWAYSHYLLGLERLGFECFWVDTLGPIDPYKDPHSLEYLVDAFARTAEELGLPGRWSIERGDRSFGLDRAAVADLSGEAELLVTISGWLDQSSPLMRIPRRAYVDIDPGFTQIWAHQGALSLEGHTHYFTVGLNVGDRSFRVPTGAVDWVPIVPPVVLEEWAPVVDERCRRWSTVMDWSGSQVAWLGGEEYGGKREEFVRLLDLPAATGVRFEPAIMIGQGDHGDLGALDEHGWRIRDPAVYAGDPDAYREFIRYSRGELSVAKGGYVKSNSGWVSDRTACYLAAGKPAVVQSTGQAAWLPTGSGLLTFSTREEAADAVRRVEEDYVAHSHAARALAEERFDSAKVIGEILDACGIAAEAPA